jgi:hypothetical protein
MSPEHIESHSLERNSMSAASHAASPVRRSAATTPAPRQGARASSGFDFSDASRGEDVMRINLQDIPPVDQSMDVEGFKPSLLSRLFDLVAPLKGR